MQGVATEPDFQGALLLGWVMGFTSEIPFN